jgi:hypothetical protein
VWNRNPLSDSVENRPRINSERRRAISSGVRRAVSRSSTGEGSTGERPHAELAQTAATWLLGLVVIGAALAIGTVHATTLLVVAALSFFTVALALYGSTTAGTSIRPALSLPVITCAALALYTLFQTLPLPMGLLRVIAPANADVWERVLLPFGEPALRWASISLDPGASVLEAVKWATYAAVFASAAAISSKRGAAWGVTLVFASAMLAAIITVAHGLAGATRVYGLYQPAFAASVWHVGPLLNPNNLAGYLNLGALAGLGLALTRKPVVPPWLIALGVMLIVGVEVTSASRGGVLALPIGVLALALVTRRQTSSGAAGRGRSIWIMVIAAIAGGAVLAALGGSRATWAELYAKDVSKIEMLLWAKPLLHDHPFFGIGRGAFESVFPVYRLVPGNLVFTHAENFPAQWASEWGIPVTLAAFIAFGWAFAPKQLGVGRSAVAAGAWMGVAVLLLQNMFDLALEVPAIVIAAASVLGSLWGDGRRRHLPRAESGTTSPRDWSLPAAIGVAAVGLALVGLGALHRSTDVASDRAALRAAYEAEGNLQYPEEVARVRDLVRAAMLRHPAEPYFPLIGALVAVRAHDQNPMPWLQHTLERGQVNGRAHLLLAEFLGARGAKKQALFELRLSVENDSGLAGPAAKTLVHWTHDHDELMTAIPPGLAGVRMLDQVAAYLDQPENWAIQSQCNQEIIARDPGEIAARVRESEARLSALDTGKPAGLCLDREACHKTIRAHATAIALSRPDSATAALLRARLLLSDKKPEEAASLLELECQKVTDRIPCLQARVSAAAQITDAHPPANGALDRLGTAAKELIGNACNTAVSCADMATWVGDIRRGRGENGLALAMYERAARADPTEERWLKLAAIASSVDDHGRAAEALERVAQRHGGGDGELRERIKAERSLAGSRLLQR